MDEIEVPGRYAPAKEASDEAGVPFCPSADDGRKHDAIVALIAAVERQGEAIRELVGYVESFPVNPLWATTETIDAPLVRAQEQIGIARAALRAAIRPGDVDDST